MTFPKKESKVLFLASLALLFLISPTISQEDVRTNTISKDTASASASSNSAAEASANSGANHPLPPSPLHEGPAPPHPGPGPIFPGAGAGAGAGFHKSLDFSVGAGKGFGPLLAGLIPGYGLGQPAFPPQAAPLPPPVGDVPDVPPIDPLLGGGPGYLGFPGFLGPSYVPYSWLGSALGAKGDLLFPVVLFVFVIVGIWTVVQFLLGLIVPLIAGKLAVGKGLLASKSGKFLRDVDPMEERQDQINLLTQQVLAALGSNSTNLNNLSSTNQTPKPGDNKNGTSKARGMNIF